MSKYETKDKSDFNLRFFFFMATGPKHHEFSGSTKIIDREQFYLSDEIAETTIHSTNKTIVDFIRRYDEA